MSSIARLAVAWLTVVAFLVLADTVKHADGLPAVVAFVWLLVVIVWSAFGVVHEAEHLAERLGEPLGTLVLTLSIVIIEVALIGAVMLDAKGAPTLGRDTMFAVLMIVLNGVVGLGLLVGGLRHHQQRYNLQGASAYLGVIIPLAMLALVLPNFTASTAGGTLSRLQSLLFSIFTIVLYALFLWLQTGRHSGFFADEDTPDAGAPAVATTAAAPSSAASSAGSGSLATGVARLLANILPIVILAKGIAALLDRGIAALGAPTALGGILIAMIVFMPEGISALRAVAANQLTRAINLCLGAAASTLGLTVPAVLLIGLLTGQQVVLGVAPANTVLLVLTLMLSMLTFSGGRTSMLEGAIHLTMFCVFAVLVFSP